MNSLKSVKFVVSEKGLVSNMSCSTWHHKFPINISFAFKWFNDFSEEYESARSKWMLQTTMMDTK